MKKRKPYDYVTLTLATTAVACLLVLAGCGPQSRLPATELTPLISGMAPLGMPAWRRAAG